MRPTCPIQRLIKVSFKSMESLTVLTHSSEVHHFVLMSYWSKSLNTVGYHNFLTYHVNNCSLKSYSLERRKGK